MTINIPILLDGLEWATREHEKQQAGLPSEWEQSYWMADPERHDAFGESAAEQLSMCGTQGCLAGYIVAKHLDIRWEWHPAGFGTWMHDDKLINFEVSALRLIGAVDTDELLGRGPGERGGWLFGGNNDIYDLWRISERLTDGAIEMPDKLQEEHALLFWEAAHMEHAMRGHTSLEAGKIFALDGIMASQVFPFGDEAARVLRVSSGGSSEDRFLIERVS